jgi:hypothetical protein
MSSSGTQPASVPAGFKAPEVGIPPRPIDKYDAPLLLENQGRRRRFHIMVKPGGSTCNLHCSYCFYLSKIALLGGPGAGRMSAQLPSQLP